MPLQIRSTPTVRDPQWVDAFESARNSPRAVLGWGWRQKPVNAVAEPDYDGPLEPLDASQLRDELRARAAAGEVGQLVLSGVHLTGQLDLLDVRLGHDLTFINVRFENPPAFVGLTGTSVHFDNCWIPSVNFDGATLSRGLYISASWIIGTIQTVRAELGELRITDCTWYDEHLDPECADRGIELSSARIAGRSRIEGCRSTGRIVANTTRFESGIDLVDLEVSCCRGPVCTTPKHAAIEMGGTNAAYLYIALVFADGECRFPGAKITESLVIQELSIDRERYDPSSGYGIARELDVQLDAPCTLDFRELRVDGRAEFVDTIAPTIDLSRARVSSVRFESVTVAGDRPSEGSLVAAEVEVEKGLVLTATSVRGTLDLSQGKIGGDLELSLDEHRSIGGLRLADARIAGDVRTSEARVLRGVDASAATIAGAFDLTEFTTIGADDDGLALKLDEVVIGTLRLGDLGNVAGEVRLHRAEVGLLDAQTPVNGRLTSRQLTVEVLDGSIAEDVDHARDWLDAATVDSRPTIGEFWIQPWVAVADAFERSGRESGGRRLRFEATDRLYARRRWLFSRTVWRWVTKVTIGHGYYSQFAILWLVALWLGATLLTAVAAPMFTPTDHDVAVPTASTRTVTAVSTPVPEGYPAFFAPLYAVDVVLSPIGTGQAEAWRPSGPWWFDATLTLIKLMSWGLLGLFITGVSGLLGRR